MGWGVLKTIETQCFPGLGYSKSHHALTAKLTVSHTTGNYQSIFPSLTPSAFQNHYFCILYLTISFRSSILTPSTKTAHCYGKISVPNTNYFLALQKVKKILAHIIHSPNCHIATNTGRKQFSVQIESSF